jgi:hypothetical protein
VEELDTPGLQNSWEIHRFAIILKQGGRSLMPVHPSNQEGLWTASGGSELSCFLWDRDSHLSFPSHPCLQVGGENLASHHTAHPEHGFYFAPELLHGQDPGCNGDRGRGGFLGFGFHLQF